MHIKNTEIPATIQKGEETKETKRTNNNNEILI